MTSLINFISGARPTRRGRAWRRGIAFLFPALALLLFRPARLRAADAGEILKGAKDAALKWKGYTCKYKTEAEQKGTKAETETGIVSYLAPSFLRIESTVHDPVSGETHKTIVTDGKFTYTEVRDPRNKIPFVTKTRNQIAEPDSIRIGQPLSPADTLDEMAKLFDLQSDDNATGEQIQEMRMSVLKGDLRPGALDSLQKKADAIPKSPHAMSAAQMAKNMLGSLLGSARLWIGEQDQFLHRVELSPPSHADGPKPAFPMAMPKTTTTYYDVTFDPPLTPADFGYAAPDGAEFHDMTAGE